MEHSVTSRNANLEQHHPTNFHTLRNLLDFVLDEVRPRKLTTRYVLQQVWQQVWSVVPLCLFLALFIFLWFQEMISEPLVRLGSVIGTTVGMILFVEGIKFGFVPLGERMGWSLFSRVGYKYAFVLVFLLGVLMPFAEPAVASLGPLSDMIQHEKQPYLYFLLHSWRTYLTIAIGVGVGLAAVLGLYRVIYQKPLLPLLAVILIPSMILGMGLYLHELDLSAVLGLAWDCGAISTGPITTSTILAIGAGAARAQNGLRTNQTAGSSSSNSSLGVVALASICPILTVEILVMALVFSHDRGYLMQHNTASAAELSLAEPWNSLINTLRAIIPLTIYMCIILFVVTKLGFPKVDLEEEMAQELEQDSTGGSDIPRRSSNDTLQTEDTRDTHTNASSTPKIPNSSNTSTLDRTETGPQCTLENVIVDPADEKHVTLLQNQSQHAVDNDSISAVNGQSCSDVVKHCNTSPRTRSSPSESTSVSSGSTSSSSGIDRVRRRSSFRKALSISAQASSRVYKNLVTYKIVWISVASCTLGLFLLNIGLVFGLTPLGQEVGSKMPATFKNDGKYAHQLSHFPAWLGLTLTGIYVFVLGVLATRAEPALSVLGMKVQTMTQGALQRNSLRIIVAIGVGLGIVCGLTMVLLKIPTIILLVVAYTIVLLLSAISKDKITGAAWDCAGATTGPVTVPILLALGISFSNAVDSLQLFGIIAIALVCPIATLLAKSLDQHYVRNVLEAWYNAMSNNICIRKCRRHSDDYFSTSHTAHPDASDFAYRSVDEQEV